MPTKDRLRLNVHEGPLLSTPVALKPDPEHPIASLELGAPDLALVDLELLPKRGDFDQEISP